MPGYRILVDTNAIVEAHRTGCWKAIVNSCQIETVEEVAVECASGGRLRRDYVPIDVEAMRKRVQVRKVAPEALIDLDLKLGGTVILDKGEHHLSAYALGQSGIWRLCSPDNNSVRAMVKLGLKERLISLEEIAARAGLKPKFKDQYGKKWLRRKTSLFFLEEF